jgi:hypothetical protein
VVNGAMHVVRDITSPTLLISAGTGGERDFDRSYGAAAPRYLEHWNLPEAEHTGALRRYPVPYEHRVVGFLRQALGVRADQPDRRDVR